jgi:hypothetical protein
MPDFLSMSDIYIIKATLQRNLLIARKNVENLCAFSSSLSQRARLMVEQSSLKEDLDDLENRVNSVEVKPLDVIEQHEDFRTYQRNFRDMISFLDFRDYLQCHYIEIEDFENIQH